MYVFVCVCEEGNRLFCRLIRDPIKKQVWEACSALIGPRALFWFIKVLKILPILKSIQYPQSTGFLWINFV